MTDAEEFPFVQDLMDNLWHKRPTDDGWDTDGEFQANTICGLPVRSIHVSSWDPRLQRVYGDKYCRKC